MPAEWSLEITTRDGDAVHTFTSDDAIDDGPIKLLGGQDSQNDIAIGQIGVPVEHAVNDHFTEDNLAHLYVRGQYVTSYIIRVPDVNPIATGGGNAELAVYALSHLLGVTEEGIVEPPGGMDSKPAGPDRIFDSSDPARDNSGDFVGVDELGSVTDAQDNYDVVPYANEMEYPDDVQVITAPGFGWSDEADEGSYYYFIDFDFPAATYRVNGTGDNFIEVRIDGKTIQPRTQGFGVAFHVPKFEITAGVHRVWAKVENVGPGGTQGQQTMALEFVAIGANDEAVELTLGTNSDWQICANPATPPGFTPGGIILTTLGEEQNLGVLLGVICSFDELNDSNGDAWADTFDVSTKSLTGLEQFWVKELTAALIDIDAHWEDGQVVIDAWPKGSHRPASGLTLTEGVNLGPVSIPGEPRVMNQAAVVWNQGGDLAYHDVTVTAPDGHPAKRRPLSLGAARSIEQAVRDATSQLDLFNRKREKPTVAHLTTVDTDDADMPPNYWKWSTIDIDLTSRHLESGTLELVAVTFQLNDNGLLTFTPEAGDLIIPAAARAGITLRKMSPPSLGGKSRVASPVSAR